MIELTAQREFMPKGIRIRKTSLNPLISLILCNLKRSMLNLDFAPWLVSRSFRNFEL